MIWAHKARLHWICRDVDGVEPGVQVIKGISHWYLLDTETGEILYSGKADHPLEAMKAVSGYVDALVDIRNALPDLEKAINELTGANYESTY